jgi:hypothetical protein
MRATDDSVDGDLLSPVITVDAAPAGPRAAVIDSEHPPNKPAVAQIACTAGCAASGASAARQGTVRGDPKGLMIEATDEDEADLLVIRRLLSDDAVRRRTSRGKQGTRH